MNANPEAMPPIHSVSQPSGPPSPNYYQRLGLRSTQVTPAEVTEALQLKMQELQIVISAEDPCLREQAMVELAEAHACLTDPHAKRRYDQELRQHAMADSNPSSGRRFDGDFSNHVAARPNHRVQPTKSVGLMSSEALATSLPIGATMLVLVLALGAASWAVFQHDPQETRGQIHVSGVETPEPTKLQITEPASGSQVRASAIQESVVQVPAEETFASNGTQLVSESTDSTTSSALTRLYDPNPFLPANATKRPSLGTEYSTPINRPADASMAPSPAKHSPASVAAPNANSLGQADSTLDFPIDDLRKMIIDGELLPEMDVIGETMTTMDRQRFVQGLGLMLDEHWDEMEDIEKLKRQYRWLKKLTKTDARLPMAVGMLMEKHGNLDEAIRWYACARATRTPGPHLGAWQRSILIRVGRRSPDDVHTAISDCVDLVDRLVKIDRYDQGQADSAKSTLINQMHFVGRVFGLLDTLSASGERRLSINLQSEEQSILALARRLRESETPAVAAFHLGKQDMTHRFVAMRTAETQMDVTSRSEAQMYRGRESQGEVELRQIIGPHQRGANGVEYYNDTPYESGLHRAYGNPWAYGWAHPWYHQDHLDKYLPIPGRVLDTRDYKKVTEWYRKDRPKYHRATRLSEKVGSHFAMNMDSERRKLMRSFPIEYSDDRVLVSSNDATNETKGNGEPQSVQPNALNSQTLASVTRDRLAR